MRRAGLIHLFKPPQPTRPPAAQSIITWLEAN